MRIDIQFGVLLCASLSLLACGGGEDGDEGGGGNADAPKTVSEVASEGFQAPADAVSSHDGQTFYFSAFTVAEPPEAAIFRVAASGGQAEALHSGAPLAYPTGLVLSCDSQTLFIADPRSRMEGADEDDEDALMDEGALYSLATSGGAPARLEADPIATPTALALSVDCATLYVTGFKADGTPALFSLSTSGGGAQVVHEGAPLVSPTGVHVDKDNVAWVMDQLADGDEGEGVLFAIKPDGTATAVISDLHMGSPGGVSLTSTGTTAVMPTLNDDGVAQLTTVSLVTGQIEKVATPDLSDPAGLRTARDAPVFALVDNAGGKIFRAE